MTQEVWDDIISVLDDGEKSVKIDMAELTKEKRKSMHLFIKRKFKNRISSTTISECGAPKYMQFRRNNRFFGKCFLT